ncbi:unnamed protein product, partial [Rotaria sp. Silwood1]
LSMDDDYETEENNLLLEMIHASLIAYIVADFFGQLLFYSIETIVHRLHVQGVRTIVDNTDTARWKQVQIYTKIWDVYLLKFSLLYGGMLLAHGVIKKFFIDHRSSSPSPMTTSS